ncbi:MAG: DUF5053 domain-containing protein [Muribaculaceae bacterium]|nr:DUF5053 domain-containing protein [Muribaculaceae bacterium]
MEKQITLSNQNLLDDAKSRLSDILLAVSWRDISRRYFGKSSSWLYHKLDGIKGDGSKGGFTPQETEILKEALNDLARRISTAASSL